MFRIGRTAFAGSLVALGAARAFLSGARAKMPRLFWKMASETFLHHETDGNGWECIEMDGNGWKCIEMDRNGWKWIGMHGNAWKWMEMH